MDEALIHDICELVDLADAISVLESARQRMPGSQGLAQSLFESYIARKEFARAKDFALSIPNLVAESPQFCLAVARLNEMFGGDREFLENCMSQFPNVPEFWLLSSSQSIAILKTALARCPSSPDLHIALAAAACRQGLPRPRIRALLERARQACREEAIVWLVSAEFDEKFRRNSVLEEAKTVVTREKGLIWARQVELADAEGRQSMAKHAMEGIGNCREVVLVTAICLWKQGAVDQARSALENLNREFPQWGDGWMFRWKLEKGQGSDLEKLLETMRRLKLSEGFVWTRMRKNPANLGFDQMELLEEMVQMTGDPMTSDVSIFGEFLSLPGP
jgi:tetratricopeptide (TPR) repeat protein